MRRRNLIRLTALCFALTAELTVAQYLEATIRVSYGTSDMVWNPATNKAYVSNGNDGTVTVIDGATNQVTTVIEVAAEPALLCVNPAANRIYCTSGESDRLNIIDAVGDTLIRSIRVRGYPCLMACNSLMNKLYVICDDDGVVRVYDGSADTLLAEVSFGERNWPVGLLWHPVSNRVFCITSSDAQSDTVFAIDCQTDLVAAKAPGGDQIDAICRNPVNDLVYVSSQYDVHVLSSTGDSVVAVVPLPPNHSIYNVCAVPFPNKVYARRGYWLYVIDGNSHVVTDSIAVYVGALICDTDRAKVYGVGNPVPVIDARGDSVLLTISIPGDYWHAVAWNSTNSRVYLIDGDDYVIDVIRDTSTAVAEPAGEARPASRPAPTMCRGRLRLGGDGPASLLDLTGRQVARLEPGDNDLRSLGAGVYFVKSDKGTLTSKVIIQN